MTGKFIGIVTVFVSLTGCNSSPDGAATESTPPLSQRPQAQLFAGFDNYSRSVTTTSKRAQKFINQGMQWLYGFNDDEAIRSFDAALRLDSNCAFAWWGIAYANGINVNDTQMSHKESRNAWYAVQKARELLPNASAVERALIEAISKRVAWPPPEDHQLLEQRYATAMADVWRRFPSDADVGTLYAEALMNLQPWDYWTPSGKPKGRAEEIVRVLETVIAMAPNHPGALHYYIHAVEASHSPERAEAAADRLANLVPGSGHLTHMPSHIYGRLGRYSDAADVTQMLRT